MNGWCRRVFAAAFALGLCWLVQNPVAAQRSYALPALKAAMLQKIVAFVRWPQHANRNHAPFVVAVLGDGDLSSRLRFVYQDHQIGGRAVQVQDIGQAANLPVCDALFVGARFASQLESLLRSVAGKPVLTLGDTPGFAQRGVAVNLVVDASRRVRFEVNRAAIESAGLSASFQLLSFATLVADARGGAP